MAADIEASNGVIHVIDQVLLPPVDGPGDLVDVAVSAGEFPTLIAAVQAAGLVDTLKSEGPFTVFAPTEAAFAAALEALGLTAAELLADVETLTAVLTYHVVPGRVMAGDLAGAMAMPVATVNGAEISVTEDGGSVIINEATVVAADIEASNGVIHVIDQVLLPPVDGPGDLVDVAVSAGEFPTLIAAVQAAGLVDTLKSEGPFTVFAPTEAAFAAALEALGLTAAELLADVETLTAVLTYHVVPGRVMAGDLAGAMAMPVATVNGAEISVTEDGGSVIINEATVVAADIEASNGVIHVIDQVLLPPVDGPGDLVDVAVSAGEFPTLIAAVQAAGLVDTLKSEGPFTVFAPTEAAFAAALEALGLTAAELLADVETLTAVLTYHVVPGRVMAGDLAGAMAMPVATVNGAEISVTEDGGSVIINEATVVAADIEASNGVIHVIDQVLLP
ncbi:MAG: hypothetical protein CM1200mP26_02720 [Acidimicrobiales bacterium]|nr:MAG: hypothetical protein CM1200mP26_02720 [Acidimicrobiales bacterium]